MLTKRDLRWNYKIFKFMAGINIYPVDFDRRTGQMKCQGTKWKKFIFKCWETLGFAHIAYMTWRTGQVGLSMGNDENPYGDFVPLMVILTSGIHEK